jgi:hypothetical protein
MRLSSRSSARTCYGYANCAVAQVTMSFSWLPTDLTQQPSAALPGAPGLLARRKARRHGPTHPATFVLAGVALWGVRLTVRLP